MTARGRPRKPLERSDLLATGDGQGTTHSHKAKDQQVEPVEYVEAELVPMDGETDESDNLPAVPTSGYLYTLKNGAEVEVPHCVPPPPGDLEARGEREWINIWTAGKAWLHKSEDYHLIEMIAHAYDEVAIYRREVYPPGQKPNLIVKGYAGQKTANPLIKEIREAERTIIKCLSMLGFSPSDRARLGLKAIQQAQGIQAMQNAANNNR